MKNLILATIFTLFSVFAFAGNDCPVEKIRTYHENGNVKLEASMDCNGELHGKFVEYFSDGTEFGYGEYDHGQKTGKWVIFDRFNPGTIYIVFYENDLKVFADNHMRNSN